MGKRLNDNLTSGYFEAANRLNSKQARRRIVAYVESYDDIFFWRTVLSQLETDRIYFEVMLPSRDSKLKRGKKAAMMSMLSDKVGGNMIACIDADYDYLLQGITPTSRAILSNPYVFHTYAYAIENMQCFATTLHDVCVAVTLNDHIIFDIERYLREFSEAIYPLFVWNIWFYRTPDYGKFTISDFLKIIETGAFSLRHPAGTINNVRRKVENKCRFLQKQNPEALESYEKLKPILGRLGVTPQNTYLFIQGHHLFDKVVLPMLSAICSKLISERQNEISAESLHYTQRRNELSCYTNSLGDIVPLLKKGTGFMRSPQFMQIKADLERFIAHLHPSLQPVRN